MKVLIFFFSCILGIFFTTEAQEYTSFDTANISWYEREESGEPPVDVKINKYFVNGDTVINNSKYFKIYQEDSGNKNYIGCFREKNKIVYYRGYDYHHFNTDSAVVLYDFTKGIGDTLYTGPYHRENIITEIDSVLVDGSYRKRYIMEHGAKWIEGIGSTYGFRYPMTEIPTAYWKCELSCFKKNQNVIYLNPQFQDCTTLTGISKHTQEKTFTVYPNPVINNVILFKFNSFDVEKITITNYAGKIYDKIQVNGKRLINISTGNYCSGLYFYAVYSKQGKKHTGKIIVK
jgi:hypothetical protein